jgi:hypothetical protein
MQGWTIDGALSNSDHVVIVDPLGRPHLAFPGAQITNLKDVTQVARELGQGTRGPKESSKAIVRSIRDKYGRLPEHISGYSMGGAESFKLGRWASIPSTGNCRHVGLN